jgi:hypothetical protein
MSKTCGGFIFGTDGVAGVVVESQSADSGPQYTAMAKDACGVTKAIQLGKPTGTMTVSGYFLDGATTPKINSQVSLEGRSFWVDKVTEQESNTDFVKAEITGKFWDGVDTKCA